MTDNTFETDISNANFNSAQYYIDDDGSFKFVSPVLASSNFDGSIPMVENTINAENLEVGMMIKLSDDNFYGILSIFKDDPDLEDFPSTIITIDYLDESNEIQSLNYDFTDTVEVRYEDWDEKYLGSKGWAITYGGNAIFANVGVRGRIEATEGDIEGNLVVSGGLFTSGTAETDGGVVLNNAGLTAYDNFGGQTFNIDAQTGAVTIGGTPGDDLATQDDLDGYIPEGGAASDIVSNSTTITGGNISTGKIKSQGYSGPGTGSAFSTAGMLINLDDGSIAAPNFKIDNSGNAHFKGIIQTASGSLGGFVLDQNTISIINFTISSSSGLRLGTSDQFKVDLSGNLVAESASITGNIDAKSGTFTGVVSILSGGALEVGSTAQKVVINDQGFFGYNQLGLLSIGIPVDGSDPTLGKFKILESGIISDTSDGGANIIVGTMSSSATTASVVSGMVLRGHRTGGNPIGLYTVSSGSATTYDFGNGFYVDELAKFKLSGNNGSLKFDGNNLFVTGTINATSGSFSGIVSSASVIGGSIYSASVFGGLIQGQRFISGSYIGGFLQSNNYSGVTDGSAFSSSGTYINLTNGAITSKRFRIDASGNAFLTGGVNATSGSFSVILISSSAISSLINSSSFVGGVLRSNNFSGVTDGSQFSTAGTFFNLNNGTITTPGFRINSSGVAAFQGSIITASIVIDAISTTNPAFITMQEDPLEPSLNVISNMSMEFNSGIQFFDYGGKSWLLDWAAYATTGLRDRFSRDPNSFNMQKELLIHPSYFYDNTIAQFLQPPFFILRNIASGGSGNNRNVSLLADSIFSTNSWFHNGSFSAISKSFDIDHPTKENFRLRYGSLEGPEFGIYIRGISTSSVVFFPDYWPELIDEESITIQLTSKGFFQNLFVQEILSDRIIVGGVENEFFYFIQAERDDIEKLVVEYEKI